MLKNLKILKTMKDKRFEKLVEELDNEKFLFTMTKDEIKDRILKNIKVERIEENHAPVINGRGELEELLEIRLKVGDLMNQSQQIELTLTHTGSEEESDVYSIFGSIYFEFEDLSVGESEEITRLSNSHTVSGRPEGVLKWLDSQIDSMTSEEVGEDGEYFRYLFN